MNLERVAAIKYLFGFENGNVAMDGLVEGTIESIEELVNLLKASDSSFLPGSDKTSLDQVYFPFLWMVCSNCYLQMYVTGFLWDRSRIQQDH